MRHLLVLGLLVATMAIGCADDAGESEQDISELVDLYRDFRNLDLGDLLNVSAGYATDEINDQLAVSEFAGIKLGETEMYALAQTSEGDLTIESIDALVSGLVDRYGYRELTTEVNLARKQQLETGAAKVYGESAFAIKAGLHDWGVATGGLGDGDGSVRVGFDAGVELEARVINAYSRELAGYYQAPLAAIKAARGFVLPRSIEDLRALAPGESYALHGGGKLGFNVGVGVPILVTSIDSVTYNVVLSGALRALLEGQLDVQVVKLPDDQLVVDVGVEQAAVRHASMALSDGWGVHGLLKTHIDIAGLSLDLGRLVEGALERLMNQKLSLVSASLEHTSQLSRISVARFRVDLDVAVPGSPVEKALAQALRADIRLAQALANRYEPGIETEFELTRSGVSTTAYAGIDLVGMSFFRKVVEGEGNIVVQTPGGARSIFFESLHRSAGWFFSSHGYTRVSLAGMVFDVDRPEGAEGEANLIFQLVEGDKKMERDKLVDHLDGVVLGVAGEKALAALEKPANALERFVENACPNSQAFDPCRVEVLDNPTVIQLREQATAALAAATQELEAPLRDLVRAAGALRIIAQATYEPKAALTGPPTSVVLDYRLDDDALGSILRDATRADFDAALRAYLSAAGIDRLAGDLYGESGSAPPMAEAQVNGAAELFDNHAKRYRNILEAEKLVLENHRELGEMGRVAMEIRFPVDRNNVPIYEEAVSRSLARARADVARSLVDRLIEQLDGSAGKHGEQAAAYALLALTPASSVDLRLDVDVDVDDSWEQTYPQYRKAGYESIDVYARGSKVAPIDGGLFDINALLTVQ